MELKNFKDFINITLGKSIDTDGFPKGQPYQCVDLAKYFNMCYNEDFQIFCSDTGYAKDWATQKDTNGILEYFEETAINNMIEGTLVVWGDCKVAPNSHIGFFVKDNGNGTFQCLQQNAPCPYVTLSNITYDGLIGAFIPKQLLIKDDKSEYINIPDWIPHRSIYNEDLKQFNVIKPQKFGGLTYKILSYKESNNKKFAQIETLDYGKVYVLVTDVLSITNKPVYSHGNF